MPIYMLMSSLIFLRRPEFVGPLTEKTPSIKWETRPGWGSPWGQCPHFLPHQTSSPQNQTTRCPQGSLGVSAGSWHLTCLKRQQKDWESLCNQEVEFPVSCDTDLTIVHAELGSCSSGLILLLCNLRPEHSSSTLFSWWLCKNDVLSHRHCFLWRGCKMKNYVLSKHKYLWLLNVNVHL